MKYSKIILIPDSFKATFTSSQIIELGCQVLTEDYPDQWIKGYPITDGGEGFGQIVGSILQMNPILIETVGAFNQKLSVPVWIKNQQAVFDVASVVGFTPNQSYPLNPDIATTYGIGLIIKTLLGIGIKQIMIGLGGSITNDGGCGILAGLNVKFYNQFDQEFIPCGSSLNDIVRIDFSQLSPLVLDGKITLCTDVINPLYGLIGAAYTFGAQKGASPQQIVSCDQGLKKLAICLEKTNQPFMALNPGMGAAGGIGYGINAIFETSFKKGIDYLLSIIDLDQIVDDKTLIITGEGRFDHQSRQGKVFSGLYQLARAKNADLALVVGQVDADCQKYLEQEKIKVYRCYQDHQDFIDHQDQKELRLIEAFNKIKVDLE